MYLVSQEEDGGPSLPIKQLTTGFKFLLSLGRND
jgi:hypothetical protein